MPIPVSTQALEVFNLNQSFLAVVAILGSDHSSRNLMFRVVPAGFQDFQNLTSRRVGRPQEENERRQQEDERQQTLLEPDVSMHPLSQPHEENERGQRGEEVQQRLQHVDEGDDCPTHYV